MELRIDLAEEKEAKDNLAKQVGMAVDTLEITRRDAYGIRQVDVGKTPPLSSFLSPHLRVK